MEVESMDEQQEQELRSAFDEYIDAMKKPEGIAKLSALRQLQRLLGLTYIDRSAMVFIVRGHNTEASMHARVILRDEDVMPRGYGWKGPVAAVVLDEEDFDSMCGSVVLESIRDLLGQRNVVWDVSTAGIRLKNETHEQD